MTFTAPLLLAMLQDGVIDIVESDSPQAVVVPLVDGCGLEEPELVDASMAFQAVESFYEWQRGLEVY